MSTVDVQHLNLCQNFPLEYDVVHIVVGWMMWTDLDDQPMTPMIIGAGSDHSELRILTAQ